MTSPRMTSEDSPDRKVESFENTVFPECFKSILGACRSKAAGGRSEGGDAHLIETYQQYEREDDDLADDRHYPVTLLFHIP